MGIYCLYVDHAANVGVSALMKDGGVVESLYCERRQSRHPCQTWQGFLDRHGLQLADISFFACGVGPGSYTGVRSAAATVQAAALATGKPIVALSSLLPCVPMEEGSYLAIADAGPGGAFVQSVTIRAGRCELSRPERMALADALAQIQPGQTPVSASVEWMPEAERPVVRVVAPHAAAAALFAYQEWHEGRLYAAHELPLEYPRNTWG